MNVAMHAPTAEPCFAGRHTRRPLQVCLPCRVQPVLVCRTGGCCCLRAWLMSLSVRDSAEFGFVCRLLQGGLWGCRGCGVWAHTCMGMLCAWACCVWTAGPMLFTFAASEPALYGSCAAASVGPEGTMLCRVSDGSHGGAGDAGCCSCSARNAMWGLSTGHCGHGCSCESPLHGHQSCGTVFSLCRGWPATRTDFCPCGFLSLPGAIYYTCRIGI